MIIPTLLTTAALIPLAGLAFPATDALAPIGICLGLSAVAWHPEPSFRLCARSLAILVGFSTIFTTLTYAMAAASPFPYADGLLVSSDRALGVDAAAVVAWTNARPVFSGLMKVVYFSIIPQTILTIVVLGFGNSPRLSVFLRHFMLCALATAICFYFFPARGNIANGVPSYYTGVLDHLERLRDGSMSMITWKGAEGIITFPSFHTIWAALIILAFRNHFLFVPMTILNVLVILSTVTTGMHYFCDVLGGLFVVFCITSFDTRQS